MRFWRMFLRRRLSERSTTGRKREEFDGASVV
jgi:hypothetical protein